MMSGECNICGELGHVESECPLYLVASVSADVMYLCDACVDVYKKIGFDVEPQEHNADIDGTDRACSSCGSENQYRTNRTDFATPGSPTARYYGCTCPVLDNGHGKGRGDGQFVINADCPLHGIIDTSVEKQVPLVSDSLANDS